MNDQQLQIGAKKWHFRVLGSGDHLLIALHGFGEDSRVFAPWEKVLGENFTILAVDLPFHGKATDWTTAEFQRTDFVQLIDILREKYRRSACSLIGHSLGARICITVGEHLTFVPNSIWLLAPDGLATRRLGLVNLLPGWTKQMIAAGLERGYRGWIKLAQHLYDLKLVDTFSLRYLRYHLEDQGRRRRLMGVWRSLVNFPVKKQYLLQLAQTGKVPVHMVLGKKDKLIDWKRLDQWLEEWPREQLHELDTGHQLVMAETAVLVKNTILR